MPYTRTLPIVIFCLFTTVNGALRLASNNPGIFKTEFPDGLPLFHNSPLIKTDNGGFITDVYDVDLVKVNCDKIQKQRLALKEPGRYNTAKWVMAQPPESIREKFNITTWISKHWTSDFSHPLMFVNGTPYKKEMVLCPSAWYTFPEDPETTLKLDLCYVAPSDVNVDTENGKKTCATNVFEVDSSSPTNVDYLGIDHEIRFVAK